MSIKRSEKIKTIKQLVPIIQRHKKEGKSVVLTTGVFDLVHLGHVNYFRESAKLGDIIVVSVVDDKFVTKGPGRPFFNQNIRMALLAALEDVDYVVLNGDYGPHENMRKIRPHVFTKGAGDKKRFRDPGSGIWKDKNIINEVGGRLVFTKELPVHSTDIFERLLGKNKNRKK